MVEITAGRESGDELVFTNQNAITGSYNPGTGVLTLTGTSSVANYQTALRSITFRNLTNNNPAASRTIRFTVNDAIEDSNALTRGITITPVNDSSVLAGIGTSPVAYTEQGTAVQVTSTLTVTDVDDTTLPSAEVDLTAGRESGDELVFTNQNGITGSYNPSTGVLTLTGPSSVANYQTALRSITFRNLANNNPNASRTISFWSSTPPTSSPARSPSPPSTTTRRRSTTPRPCSRTPTQLPCRCSPTTPTSTPARRPSRRPPSPLTALWC